MDYFVICLLFVVFTVSLINLLSPSIATHESYTFSLPFIFHRLRFLLLPSKNRFWGQPWKADNHPSPQVQSWQENNWLYIVKKKKKKSWTGDGANLWKSSEQDPTVDTQARNEKQKSPSDAKGACGWMGIPPALVPCQPKWWRPWGIQREEPETSYNWRLILVDTEFSTCSLRFLSSSAQTRQLSVFFLHSFLTLALVLSSEAVLSR